VELAGPADVGIEIGEAFDLDQTSSHGIANWLLLMWGFLMMWGVCQDHRDSTGDRHWM
jgi:hypothetical protein